MYSRSSAFASVEIQHDKTVSGKCWNFCPASAGNGHSSWSACWISGTCCRIACCERESGGILSHGHLKRRGFTIMVLPSPITDRRQVLTKSLDGGDILVWVQYNLGCQALKLKRNDRLLQLAVHVSEAQGSQELWWSFEIMQYTKRLWMSSHAIQVSLPVGNCLQRLQLWWRPNPSSTLQLWSSPRL